MEIKDRIKLIMERENISSGIFAESIGVQQSTLSHLLNGRNKPSLDVIMKIHQKYNYINLEWLLYGTGYMAVNTKKSVTTSKSENDFPLFANTLPIDKGYEPNKPEPCKEQASVPQSAPLNIPVKEIIKQEIRYIDKPSRKITEIRVFFDDNTYEIFKSEKCTSE